jgi:hypothetical protein
LCFSNDAGTQWRGEHATAENVTDRTQFGWTDPSFWTGRISTKGDFSGCDSQFIRYLGRLAGNLGDSIHHRIPVRTLAVRFLQPRLAFLSRLL